MPRDACAPKGMAWLLLLLIVLSFTTASGPLRANDRALEYRVKAEFLYNFARFVEWPEGSQDKDREAVVIGILRGGPLWPNSGIHNPREKCRRKATEGQEDGAPSGGIGWLSLAFH